MSLGSVLNKEVVFCCLFFCAAGWVKIVKIYETDIYTVSLDEANCLSRIVKNKRIEYKMRELYEKRFWLYPKMRCLLKNVYWVILMSLGSVLNKEVVFCCLFFCAAGWVKIVKIYETDIYTVSLDEANCLSRIVKNKRIEYKMRELYEKRFWLYPNLSGNQWWRLLQQNKLIWKIHHFWVTKQRNVEWQENSPY